MAQFRLHPVNSKGFARLDYRQGMNYPYRQKTIMVNVGQMGQRRKDLHAELLTSAAKLVNHDSHPTEEHITEITGGSDGTL